MKTHTTNYNNGFIAIADDCPAHKGEIPQPKGGTPTVASMQYDIVSRHPYKYTSDDVLFAVYAERNNIPKAEMKEAREKFFSKGQPCFRTSPLTKRYGWGLHSDEKGRIALYGCETPEYEQMVADEKLIVVKAMNSSRAK